MDGCKVVMFQNDFQTTPPQKLFEVSPVKEK
jgi:hypothetical protein